MSTRVSALFFWCFLLTCIDKGCDGWEFDSYDFEDMPNTPGFTTPGGYEECLDIHSDSYVEYGSDPLEPEGSWTGASIHDPTHLISTEDGYLLVFGSGQNFCGGTAIMYKYLEPGGTEWKLGPQMYGSSNRKKAQDEDEDEEENQKKRCKSGSPIWIPRRNKDKDKKKSKKRPLIDFDAPDVLYSPKKKFPTPSGKLRHWVMYYSVYINTPDVKFKFKDEVAQACIGRATAVGKPDDLRWIDDGKPVYCSNTIFQKKNRFPKFLRYDSEEEYMEEVNDGYGIDPAIVYDNDSGKPYITWGSGKIYIAALDPSTGHLVDAAQSKKARGPTKDPDDIDGSNADAYTLLSVGGDGFNEAPYIFFHPSNRYYYLFVNFWGCCAGVCSTYELRMGRSTTLTGPYRDKAGKDMANGTAQSIWGHGAGGGSVLLRGSGRYIGPGHAGVFSYGGSSGSGSGENNNDDDRKFVFTFHFYDRDENGMSKLAARQMTFDDDNWPVLSDKPWDVTDFHATVKTEVKLSSASDCKKHQRNAGILRCGPGVSDNSSAVKAERKRVKEQISKIPLS